MLLGNDIIIHIYHENLTHPKTNYTSQIILNQRLIIEEFGAKLKLIPGVNNTEAYALSRLPINPEESFHYMSFVFFLSILFLPCSLHVYINNLNDC